MDATGIAILCGILTFAAVITAISPQRPQIWFISHELSEGCKVEQKMGPHVIALYPR